MKDLVKKLLVIYLAVCFFISPVILYVTNDIKLWLWFMVSSVILFLYMQKKGY